MADLGTMRDLDQIREREDGRDPARTVVLAVGGLAAACVLFAAGVLIGRDNDNARATRREDPLARLDALATQAARAPTPEVTYPSQLAERRTTLEGASGASSGATNSLAVAGTAASPSPLPSGSAPTQTRETRAQAAPASALIDNTGAVRPQGPMPARLPVASAVVPAAPVARDDRAERGTPAPAGSDGTFSLQVSSFRNLAGAQTFATRLRERGHRAFVASGMATTGTGTWHRVRIGPFGSMRDVARYRTDFEARERLPTFVVRRDDETPRH